jgi:hypothetical protein
MVNNGMDKHAGFIVWNIFFAIIAFVVYYFLQGYFLYLVIKKNPVYTNAQIVKYFPKTPNDLGKVDMVMTYEFSVNNIVYIKDNQTLNINSIDLGDYHVGKDIPIVYYRKNPNYSKIDYYNKNLKR